MARIGITAAVARIICFAIFIAGACLVTSPALAIADSSVHGNVYDWSTFNTMSNAVVEVYTIPNQTLIERAVIKSGSYAFSLPAGTYRLDAKAGTAGTQSELVATENITVLDNGDYVIDLILFPPTRLDDLELMKEPGNLNATQVEQQIQPTAVPTAVPATEKPDGLMIYGLIGIVIALLAIVAGFLILRRGKPRSAQEKIEPATQAESLAETPETTDNQVQEDIEEDETSVTPPESQQVQPVSVQNQLLPPDCREVLAILEKKGGRITQLDLRKLLPYSEAKVSLIISDLESRGLVKKIKKGRGNVLILNRYDEKQPDK